MSNKDNTHQSPIHGTEESQPGMDSLHLKMALIALHRPLSPWRAAHRAR